MDESQSTTTPRIPPELILRIVELTENSATLAALALTCKSITMDAQKRLDSSFFIIKSQKSLRDFCSKVLENGAKKAGLVRRLDADLRPEGSFQILSDEDIAIYQDVMSALVEMVNLTELHLDVLNVRDVLGGEDREDMEDAEDMEDMEDMDSEEPMSDLMDCTFQLRNFSLNVTTYMSDYNGLDQFLAKQPTLQRVGLPYLDNQWIPLNNISLPHLRLLKAPTNFLMAILPDTEDL
ncbi:hypothetical protein D9613_007976 [Agrocybe pediades]|uniref:F-box domain-containing protein n=1 Tax=Agrocybe pediades TaxID=84607 RepID=A0A8H4QN05_9AGAR|nr:hypothetical protein D9613_007976 [Agrocybe pediades]